MNIFRCAIIITTILFCGTALAAEKPLKMNVPATQQGVAVQQASPMKKAPSLTDFKPQKAPAIPTLQNTLVKLNSTILLDNVTVQYCQEVLLRATLLGPDGKPIGGQMVEFKINPDKGQLIGGSVTDSTGVAKWGSSSPAAGFYCLKPGIYVTQARFNGNATIPAGTRRGLLTVQKANTTFSDIKFVEYSGSPDADELHMKMGRQYRLRGRVLAGTITPVNNYYGGASTVATGPIEGVFPVTQKNIPVAISINGVFWQNSEINIANTDGKFHCVWTPPINTSFLSVGYLFRFTFLGNDYYNTTTAERSVNTMP